MFDLSPKIVAEFTLEIEYRTTYPLSSQNRTKYHLENFKVFFGWFRGGGAYMSSDPFSVI